MDTFKAGRVYSFSTFQPLKTDLIIKLTHDNSYKFTWAPFEDWWTFIKHTFEFWIPFHTIGFYAVNLIEVPTFSVLRIE